MSAAEIMEKLRALPASEQQAFVQLYQQMQRDNMRLFSSPRSVSWPDIEARQRAILGSRVVPENVVLAARHGERW